MTSRFDPAAPASRQDKWRPLWVLLKWDHQFVVAAHDPCTYQFIDGALCLNFEDGTGAAYYSPNVIGVTNREELARVWEKNL